MSSDCLRIAIFGALINQRHEPSVERGKGVPIEGGAIKQKPKHHIKEQDAECGWNALQVPQHASEYDAPTVLIHPPSGHGEEIYL
jgi:hypothetical protein